MHLGQDKGRFSCQKWGAKLSFLREGGGQLPPFAPLNPPLELLPFSSKILRGIFSQEKRNIFSAEVRGTFHPCDKAHGFSEQKDVYDLSDNKRCFPKRRTRLFGGEVD